MPQSNALLYNCDLGEVVGNEDDAKKFVAMKTNGEGHGLRVYIKYAWSIGNCATWCNIPAPSSCRSLVAFNL